MSLSFSTKQNQHSWSANHSIHCNSSTLKYDVGTGNHNSIENAKFTDFSGNHNIFTNAEIGRLTGDHNKLNNCIVRNVIGNHNKWDHFSNIKNVSGAHNSGSSNVVSNDSRSTIDNNRNIIINGQNISAPNYFISSSGTINTVINLNDSARHKTTAVVVPVGVSWPKNDVAEVVTDNEQLQCSLCLENKHNICIVDCGHTSFCLKCLKEHVAKNKAECPSCRSAITKVIRTFE